VADGLLGSIVENFDFDRALLLGAPQPGRYELLSHRGAVNADVTGHPQPNLGSVVNLAANTRQTHLFSRLDPAADPWLDALMPKARDLVVVPLSTEGRTIGVLVIEHKLRAGSRIAKRLVDMVERFASHGALALRNAWLLDEVQQLASTDALTKIANRMTFQDTLERELSRASREGGDVTLLMLDIDHFKKLNDTRGHQAGDEVLRQVAATLSRQQRDYDTAARYGGEEFALILPGVPAAESGAVAERVREAIASNGCDVTASIGVATFPQDALTEDALVGAADEALYRSKHGGRNRVTQFSAPGAPVGA
jgi:diguanylate cyclase (GGDEF)-like protein